MGRVTVYVCPNCRNRYKYNHGKCPSCGTKLEAQTVVEVEAEF